MPRPLLRPAVACLLAFIPAIAAAQTDEPLAGRRIVVERDVDFFGSDLRSIFDSSLEVCRQACLTEEECTAFTFNSRNGSCFLKSELVDRQPYPGAISARVVERQPQEVATAATRGSELSFLDPTDLDAARDEAAALPLRHPTGGMAAVEALQQAREGRASGNPGAALNFTGIALAQSDSAELWVEYARLALDMPTTEEPRREELRGRALADAVAAYLRAGSAEAQVAALDVMAQALERNGRGRTSIDALRLEQSVVPREDLAARLDKAIGQYGFRVTETSVDSDAASPRICATFSEPLVQAGTDYTPFVQTGTAGLTVSAEDNQLCLDGVEHGSRYQLALRAGLPAASGETLAEPVEITQYVRDRQPSLRFAGRGYVLPEGGPVAVPIVSVNAPEAELVLRRISDRNLTRALLGDMFARPVPGWQQEAFQSEISSIVWQGDAELATELNQETTTSLPLQEIALDLTSGVYALQATLPDADPYGAPPATQWFVVTDLGLSTLSGTDGLHVFARHLADATEAEGVELTLVSRANAVLGSAATDAAGYARFAPGLARGSGADAPALVMAETGGDMAFLPLTDPEFDLSDRGVAGREPSGPVDVFLATDRGVYRAGDTIHATVLARDGRVAPIVGLPLTAILSRPDGVEYARTTSTESHAGGHVFDFDTLGTVPRGTWTLAMHADPEAEPLATETVLIEDFLPERIDAELSLPEGPLTAGQSATLDVDARYLFGAPAPELAVEAVLRAVPAEGLPDWPGYRFGRHDAEPTRDSIVLDPARSDAEGRAALPFRVPALDADRPMEAQITVSVTEGSGRPIERRITRPIAPQAPMIGIRPLFDGPLDQGAEAAFDVIALGPDGAPAGMEVRWTLNRIETRYQWFSLHGDWDWEPVTRRVRVADGEATTGDEPARIAAPVDWGRYELVVERLGGAYVAASRDFEAGFYAAGDSIATPDVLETSLDAESYAPGDTARLRIVARSAGRARIAVISDRLVDTKMLDVPEGESVIDLPVTEDWRPGAYVTAQLVAPAAGDQTAPVRALGLAHATVDPGDQRLDVGFDVPASVRPRQSLDVALKVDGAKEGDTAWATIAAVDVGILNVTGFDAPDPAGHYFGQRRLGMGLRDLYGRLIDARSGQTGRLRQGGDAGAAMQIESPPPADETVALFSGPLKVAADGTATTSFDLPAFNGTVRLMAIVWSEGGVGRAAQDVIVRDPVVAQATLPRFLAPGDTARMRLDLTHADGPAGAVELSLTGDPLAAPLRRSVRLEDQGTGTITVPITAGAVGDHEIALSLTTPGNETLTRTFTLPVRLNDPEEMRTSRFDLAPGDAFTFDDQVFAGFLPGTGHATLTAGPLARFDAPGLLQALDRYPYGCTEQTASQAMPLLYLSSVAGKMGLDERAGLGERVERAVESVLTNQASNGSFGLWRAGSGDFWLDAYVTDFLSRARAEGIAVPDAAFRLALDNLLNRVNYAPDFDRGGEDIAYALHVLAREGAARIGDLRYYADVKADAFPTPLALAQLGAALAAYGDPTRADRMFRLAQDRLADGTEPDGWRNDYGTRLRDSAAVLTLAVEAGSEAVNRDALISTIAARPDQPRSTQEAAWSLLAANAMIGALPGGGLTVNGTTPDGPVIEVRSDEVESSPVAIGNAADSPATLTLSTLGVPETAPPAGGTGYTIERRYFSLDGEPVDPDGVAVGTRLVTVLTIAPAGPVAARLIVNDPLPAGFEIDNPALLRAGDVRSLDWLDVATDVEMAEFRSDRFLSAVNWRSDDALRLAYIVRAITPGAFRHPAASVADMYRPRFRARTATGRVEVVE